MSASDTTARNLESSEKAWLGLLKIHLIQHLASHGSQSDATKFSSKETVASVLGATALGTKRGFQSTSNMCMEVVVEGLCVQGLSAVACSPTQ